MAAVHRQKRQKISVCQNDGAVGKPATPFVVNADHERRRVMPAGQLAQLLQADRAVAGINDAVIVVGKMFGKNLRYGLENVIVNRILTRHAGSLNTRPKAFAAVPEQDQLAEVFGVAQR